MASLGRFHCWGWEGWRSTFGRKQISLRNLDNSANSDMILVISRNIQRSWWLQFSYLSQICSPSKESMCFIDYVCALYNVYIIYSLRGLDERFPLLIYMLEVGRWYQYRWIRVLSPTLNQTRIINGRYFSQLTSEIYYSRRAMYNSMQWEVASHM